MTSFCLLIVNILLYSTSIFGQNIEGKIVNNADNTPVGFANIGIAGTMTGTYSDENGEFSLNVDNTDSEAVLIISAIGFETIRINLNELNKLEKQHFSLLPKKYELETISVNDSRLSAKTVGNRWLPNALRKMAYTSDHPATRLGKSIAIKIELRQNPPLLIDEVSVGIYENPWKSARYRCRFMSINPETGEPDTTISNIAAITDFTEEEGWVHFTFQEDTALPDNDFYLVIENLDDEGEWRNPNGLRSPAPIYMFNFWSLSKQPVYLSNAGLQSWERKSKDPVFRLKYAYEK